MNLRRAFASADFVLISCALLLAGIGLAMLASAADTAAVGISPLLYRQGIALCVGIILCLVAMKVPYHTWKRFAPGIFAIGLVAQFTLSFTGRLIRGTVSRLDFFGFQIQPSEFVKVALVLMIAWVLSKQRQKRSQSVLGTLAVVAVPIILVLREPDLGMAAVMIALWAGMLLVFGLPWKTIGILAALGALLFGIGWQTVLLPYQKERVLTFLNPTADPLRSGYNVTQSIIALGSGQFFGRGLGHGPQSQLKFLPERHTDFIFASVGEELGFVGIALVTVLYGIILARIIGIVRSTNDPFGQLLGTGAFFVLIAGFTVNAGMNMGILPVTGIPLPFVSYGGSNLITSWFLLGLTESIKIHSKFSSSGPMELSIFT